MRYLSYGSHGSQAGRLDQASSSQRHSRGKSVSYFRQPRDLLKSGKVTAQPKRDNLLFFWGTVKR